MPMYDYRCKECEHQFELLVKWDDHLNATKEPCPKCGKTNCVEWGYFSKKAPAGYVDLYASATRNLPGAYRERRQEMARHHGSMGRW